MIIANLDLAIVGSRDFTNYEFLEFTILNKYKNFNIERIISGGAPGTDTLAKRFAEKHNIPITIYYPDWDKYGKRAGFLRNKEIISDCNSVLAFWDYKSKGTKLTIDLAKKFNIQLKIIDITNFKS